MSPVIQYILTNAILSYYLNSVPFNTLKHETYDFIIIGGGTAGAVIASKLSADERFKVLLLERGGNSGNFYTEIPYVVLQVGYGDSVLVKRYKSTPQARACSITNGLCTLYAGNGLGGGSTHNEFVYARGSPLDYDDWQNVYGARGWSYKDVLPYFKSIENYSNMSLRANRRQHGHHGNLIISTPNSYPNLNGKLISALAAFGYKIGDYNSDNQNQYSITQDAVGNGRRQSSWNKFLEPVIGRPNLDIISFATVIKINFDNNRRAVSVTYRRKDGVDEIVKVSKEVILSAGAIDTPKILMLSGVGDANYLSRLGVPVISNLPSVGKSLQDQIEVNINFTMPKETPNPTPTLLDLDIYKINQSGLLSKDPNLVNGFLIDKIASRSYQDTRFANEFVFDTENNQLFDGTITIGVKSRGDIKLASANHEDDPLINPNYFSSDQDLNIFKRGIKQIAKISLTSKILRKSNIQIKHQQSRCGLITEQSIINDETFLDCFVRTYSVSSVHLGSSCRMGSRNDPLSCVDANLKLLGGIQNVRVMDASVMPAVTRGNTNAPTTMIAVKGSDMMLKEYQGMTG